jgi:tetratricopeptide (TPR) repeat protein
MAAEKYEAARRIFEKAEDYELLCSTWYNLGVIYRRMGNEQKSLECFREALVLAKKTNDAKMEALAATNLNVVQSKPSPSKTPSPPTPVAASKDRSTDEGIRLFNEAVALRDNARSQEDLTKAVEKYELALNIFEKAGDKESIAKTAHNMGNVFAHWGHYQKAMEYYEKALQLQRKLGDLQGEGTSLGNLGTVYYYWGQYQKAVKNYEKALELQRKLGNLMGEGVTLNNLGLVFKSWGHYQEALECYEKSLELARKLGDSQGEGATLGNVANLFMLWGQYQKTVEYCEKALELQRKLGDIKSEGASLGSLGNVYYLWGDYQKAIEYYEKALQLQRKFGDPRDEGVTLNNLGSVFAHWGHYQKALEYYEKSLELATKLGDLKSEEEILQNLGKVSEHRGEYRQAIENYEQALAICAKIGLPADSAKDHMGNLFLGQGDLQRAEKLIKEGGYDASLGRLSLIKHEYEKAKAYYEKAMHWAEMSRSADGLFIAYTGLGLACEGLGDNFGAAANFRKAIDHTEELRSGLKEVERAEFYNVRKGGFYRTAPYEGLTRVLVKMNKLVEALKYSEYTKARVFAEGLSRRAEGSVLEVPAQITARDSELNEQLSALTKNLQKGYEKENGDIITALEPQVKEAKDKLEAHVDMLRKQYPRFAATRYPQPMDLTQTALKDNEWVLAYDVTDSGILIYLTRGKNLVK